MTRVAGMALGCVVVLIGCCTAAPRARAQDIAAARACAPMTVNAARLACYDAAFATATTVARATPPAAPAAPASAAPAAAAVPAPSFGDTGHLAPEVKAQEAARQSLPKSLNLTVQNAVALPHGLYRLYLDNDQVWETRDAHWAVAFQANDAVTITRMLMGGYQISLSGRGQSIGIKRIK
jgi:hypothetical protein